MSEWGEERVWVGVEGRREGKRSTWHTWQADTRDAMAYKVRCVWRGKIHKQDHALKKIRP